jgi:hypothetical protein
MTIGLAFSSGNDAMTAIAPSIVRSWLAIPICTWPSTTLGAPLAWKDKKSIGVPVLPVA